jgi:hypothetical protein
LLDGQSEESYEGTSEVFNMCKYASLQVKAARKLILNGGPGCGKPFQLQMAALYAYSLGLSICMTVFMCDRALQLGGCHIMISSVYQ